MDLYEVPLFMSLFGFGTVRMLVNFICMELCGFKSSFIHTRPICFRCLHVMESLSVCGGALLDRRCMVLLCV